VRSVKVFVLAFLVAASVMGGLFADGVKNPEPGVLWLDTFDTLTLEPARHKGWWGGDPPSASLTIRDSVLTIREIGKRNYGSAQRYIPYSFKEGDKLAPYLQLRFLKGPGVIGIGNASTGGQHFSKAVMGPGLYTIDLRRTTLWPSRKGKSGVFGLSLVTFGPRGNKPGPETRLDWVRVTGKSEDMIEVNLKDAQKEGVAGHGAISVGDKLEITLLTSGKYESVIFHFFDAKTRKPVMLDGKTSFIAATDPDRRGAAWQCDISVTDKSDTTFKTRYIRKGQLKEGMEQVHVVAECKGGPYSRLMGYMPYGFDLTPATGGGPGIAAAIPLEKLLHGKVLFESNFNKGQTKGWRIVAGDKWVALRDRFGDLSDSKGPEGHGNWAAAGEQWWEDYEFEAEMSEEMDGAGSVFLAVRFQNPMNYYALEWDTKGKDSLRLVRCKDGRRYTLTEATGIDLSKFPFTIAVAINGDLLTGSLNGKPMLNAYVGDHDKGPAAIGEIGRKVLVDNVKITRIVSKKTRSTFHRNLTLTYGIKPRYFLRDTGAMKIPFILENKGKEAFEKAVIDIQFIESEEKDPIDGAQLAAPIHRVFDTIAPGSSVEIVLNLDTRKIRAGEYMIKSTLSLPRDGVSNTEIIPFGIARNWNPERFNYFTWGQPREEDDIKDYIAHGHTMGISGYRAQLLDWQHNGAAVPKDKLPSRIGPAAKGGPFHWLDLCLKYGMVSGTNLQAWGGSFWPGDIYGKNGQDKKLRIMQPFNQKFREFSLNFTESHVRELAQYPAFRILNINTETEFHNHADYSALGLARLKKDTGLDAPPKGCDSFAGFRHTEMPGLVKDGIIEDTHPVLKYYRWFWQQGEGWNTLAVEMGKRAKKAKPSLLVYHDPAARMPYFRDRHDGIDGWDWTYTNPNAGTLPYKIDVLRAIRDTEKSTVCNYVQVLWKRLVIGDRNLCPSTSIIRLGLLLSSSRPVTAVGHWNTNWMRDPAHLDRWDGVRRLQEEFWKPVGPVLTNLKMASKRDIAFVVSHTNEIFAAKHRGLWQKEGALAGWHEAFMRNGLSVDILLEKDVTEGKLANYKVAFLPMLEITSRSVQEGLIKYARAGGKIVADNNLGFSLPNVTTLKTDLNHLTYPNWAWMRVRNEGQGIRAPERIKKMWETVAEIKKVFAAQCKEVAQPSDPWLTTTGREFEGVPYVYAVNDKRSAGAVGKRFGTILEVGEPLTASLSAPAKDVAAVYDLVTHRKVAVTRKGDRITWQKDYAPASATVFALLPQEIGSLRVSLAPDVKRGGSFELQVNILDVKGKPVRGVLPIRFTLRDSQGMENEYSDTFAVKNGTFTKQGNIALNDLSGTWSAKIDDLASGLSKTIYFKVTK
jgi:Beta-galactosidase trimerisation domain